MAGAVITVPAYFDEDRRRATAAAGEIAGLNVIDIVNEPTAAALAYAFRDFINRGGRPDDVVARAIAATAPHTAVVYNLGGGTFDVTILRIAGDDLTVLATDGDARLGGRDFDEIIVDWAADCFINKHGSDPHANPLSFQGLVLAAEEAKKDLFKLQRTRIAVQHDGETMVLEISRIEFERLSAPLLQRTRDRVNRVIDDAGLTWSQVHEVLAVGGSARMPQVLKMLREVTGKVPNCSLPPDEAVAQGAAIHAAIKAVDLWVERSEQADAERQRRRWSRCPRHLRRAPRTHSMLKIRMLKSSSSRITFLQNPSTNPQSVLPPMIATDCLNRCSVMSRWIWASVHPWAPIPPSSLMNGLARPSSESASMM